MLIVAFSGWKKSGKDSAANILIKDYGFSRIAYADPLKENVARDFNVTLESLHDQDQKELPLLNMPVYCKDEFSVNFNKFMFREFKTITGKTPQNFHFSTDGQMLTKIENFNLPLYWTRRALCIAEGSTKRCANPDYWVERAIRDAKERKLDKVVIADLRYRNEIAATKLALNNETDRLVTVRVNRFDTTESTDPSENDLNNAQFDYVVENRGTLEEFISKINKIVQNELNRPVG